MQLIELIPLDSMDADGDASAMISRVTKPHCLVQVVNAAGESSHGGFPLLHAGRVCRITIAPNSPSLDRIVHYCAEMHAFLQKSPDHVLFVHQKGDRGLALSGWMLAAFLLFSGVFHRAHAALSYYLARRRAVRVAPNLTKSHCCSAVRKLPRCCRSWAAPCRTSRLRCSDMYST